MVDKAEVIAEIHRLTAENNGVPIGQQSFFALTAIRPHEVLGRFWARWGDALAEAGYAANSWNSPLNETAILSSYVALSRKLGRLPTRHEMTMERSVDPSFPHTSTLLRRLGTKDQRVEAVRAYCIANPGNEDVLAMCPEPVQAKRTEEEPGPSEAGHGFVYLLKSGRFYKIGRSNDARRRGYEIRLQQPEPVEEVWTIKTDDPEGIEAYWHLRFADRRQGGEWFDLRKADVDAFKRWRRIY